MKGNFLTDLASLLQGTVCQICYDNMEVIDMNGTWCKRCHKEFTEGLVDSSKRVSISELIRKYRKPTK